MVHVNVPKVKTQPLNLRKGLSFGIFVQIYDIQAMEGVVLFWMAQMRYLPGDTASL